MKVSEISKPIVPKLNIPEIKNNELINSNDNTKPDIIITGPKVQSRQIKLEPINEYFLRFYNIAA